MRSFRLAASSFKSASSLDRSANKFLNSASSMFLEISRSRFARPIDVLIVVRMSMAFPLLANVWLRGGL